MGRGLHIFITILLCCGAEIGAAQSVSSSIDHQKILIGEPINYRILFTLPTSDYQIDFNLPDSFPHFEVMDKKKYDSTAQGKFFIVQDLKLTSWDSGSWQIPALAINIKKGSSVYPMRTDAQPIEVGYAVADSTGELRDIKPVREVFYIDRSWIYKILGIIALLILSFYLYRVFKKLFVKEQFKSGYISPYDEAMLALNQLAILPAATQEEAKDFHSSLVRIFKIYYQRKRSRMLQTLTSTELVKSLQQQGIPQNIVGFVETALEVSDSAKFARYLPPAYETEKCVSFVKEAVEGIENLKKDN